MFETEVYIIYTIIGIYIPDSGIELSLSESVASTRKQLELEPNPSIIQDSLYKYYIMKQPSVNKGMSDK